MIKYYQSKISPEVGVPYRRIKIWRNIMEKYVNPEIEVLEAAADVISSSVSYDENETSEDKFFSV